jgi:membrane protease YdiL (CAAX protease family)
MILEGFAVYIATMAAFVLCERLLLKLGPAVNVLLVVPVALAFLWLCLRGASWESVRREIGWTSGRGVSREMAAGIAGYIAGLPLILASLLVVGILSKLVHITPTHPIERELQQPGATRIFLFVLACILAPIAEETMFRGMLFSHLRARHGWWISAIFVSLIFAAIHPQGWVGIPALATIAMILAALREKRGSLIAPMTAHALNNFMLLVFVVLAAG